MIFTAGQKPGRTRMFCITCETNAQRGPDGSPQEDLPSIIHEQPLKRLSSKSSHLRSRKEGTHDKSSNENLRGPGDLYGKILHRSLHSISEELSISSM